MPSNSLTGVTRRDIRRALSRERIWWAGELDEVEFLTRIYDLASLPSEDPRYPTAGGDIWQHRINNEDWPDDWVFEDDRFQLRVGPDEVLLGFLAESLHPEVRGDRSEVTRIARLLNELLEPDGWALVETASISGRPIYGAKRLSMTRHAVSAATLVTKVVDAEYIDRQISRMTSALDSDTDLAIGTAKELVESCCHTILASRGKPAEDKPDLLPLVRRVMEELRLVPEGVAEEQQGARAIKSLLGNLAVIVQNLAELRNLYGTGHGKHGKRVGLPVRHARLIVTASTALVVFLFDTHEARGPKATV